MCTSVWPLWVLMICLFIVFMAVDTTVGDVRHHHGTITLLKRTPWVITTLFLSIELTNLCICTSVCALYVQLFGLGTTSLFHVLFKPYVMRMWLTNGERTQLVADPELTVETLTLFAQLTKHHFKLSDASPPPAGSMHPMLSFQAKGKSFFVHPEVFEDRDFAEKLIGKKITAPRKDDDDDEDDE